MSKKQGHARWGNARAPDGSTTTAEVKDFPGTFGSVRPRRGTKDSVGRANITVDVAGTSVEGYVVVAPDDGRTAHGEQSEPNGRLCMTLTPLSRR